MAVYIRTTASRLGAKQGLWGNLVEKYTSLPFTTLVPVVCAETMSWSGVLSGSPEPVAWCVMMLVGVLHR